MTKKQKDSIRLAVLRLLLHPASSLADVIEGIPYDELKECLDIATETLTARLEMFERAKIRKRNI
jgi:hypothetical protein